MPLKGVWKAEIMPVQSFEKGELKDLCGDP